MKYLFACAACVLLAMPAVADGHVDAEVVEKIEAMLAEMECQMDPGDIEVEEDGGYKLDDVICKGGDQFDITLDADLNETGRSAE